MSSTKVQAKDVSEVKQWFAKHPRRAVNVSLSAKDAEGAVVELVLWPCSEVAPERAQELVSTVDSFARAQERDCLASVRWLDKDDRLLQTRLLKRRCEAVEPEAVGPMSGSPQDQAAQAQRHLEKMTTLYYNGIGGMMLQMKNLAESCVDMARQVMQQGMQDRQQIAELQEQIQDIVVSQAEAAAEGAEEAAKAAEKEKEPSPVDMAIGMGVQMLMAGAAQNNKPTGPNGAPSA